MSGLDRRRERLLEMLGRGELPDLGGLVTRSPRMRAVMREVLIAACLGRAILLTGETGSGKSAIAAWVAACLELPFRSATIGEEAQSLVTAKLFGAKRGAATGMGARMGLLECNGVLLVDEIGNASAETEHALLGVVQTWQFSRVGDDADAHPRSVACDLIIYATHSPHDLRQDLRARMAGAVIELPPLSERREDIAPIIKYALAHLDALRGAEIDSDAVSYAESVEWPGNIRALLKTMEAARRKALLRGARVISCADLDAAREGVVGLVAPSSQTEPRLEPAAATERLLPPPVARQSAATLTTARVAVPDARWVQAWRLHQAHGAFSTSTLAEALGQHQRTARRLVRQMEESGVAERGSGTRYRWVGPPPEGA